MSDYYKNLTKYHLNKVLPLKELFSSFDTYYNSESFDLYFLGIKKGNIPNVDLEKYTNIGVMRTTFS